MSDRYSRLSLLSLLLMAAPTMAGEEAPVALSEVPEKVIAIAKDKIADVTLVSANTDVAAVFDRLVGAP